MKLRLLLLLLIASVACEGQTLLSRQVVLTRNSGTAGQFLDELDSIQGITLSYSSGVIDLSKKIQTTGDEKTVEDFLKTILKGQPVRYRELNGKIFFLADEPVKKKFTISGYISDNKSGERLIGASLYDEQTKQGTTSNTYGFYSLTLEQDSVKLLVSYSGYTSQAFSIDLKEDILLNIALDPKVVLNETVVVNAESKTNTQNRTLPGKIDINSSLIKSVPALLGEPDVLKTLQLLPGIQAGNEGTSGLVVRGGSADQNLVLLDGIPVYNASHAFGLFSIFNADAVNSVEVLKSGFPASYGGRLSSVIDVHMREGDKYNFHGEGGIGMIFSKLTLEGPLKKGKSSFLISARRTYLDLLAKPILKSTSIGKFDLFFTDIILKTNFPIGKKDRIYFSFYTGKDKFRTIEDFSTNEHTQRNDYGFSWGNITAMTRLNHVYSKKLFSNLTYNYSRFGFDAFTHSVLTEDMNGNPQDYQQKYLSSIQDHNIKYDVDYLPSPKHFIKFGTAVTLHHYRPGVTQSYLKDTVVRINERLENHSLYTGEYDLYAEDDVRLSDRLKMNIGMRLTGFNVSNSLFFSVQPRLNALYKLNDKWSLKGSAVKMNQYIHLLTNSNMGLPTDLWVPVTKRIPQQVSYQFSGGISYSQHKFIEVSMEIYYKHLQRVIEYKEGLGFNTSSNNWEDLVELGKGKTYGAEWLLQKNKGKLTGLLSYTLSKSTRTFDNINNGKPFPYKYDRRHEIKMALVWKPSRRLELGCDWLFSTGNAVSLPVSYYYNPATGQTIDIYSGRNDFRMPAYHRMDVSVKMIKQKRTHERSWVLGIYNVYNHQNPFFIYRRTTYVAPGTFQASFRQISLFPILPSFSYQFKF
ncbi:MAG: TonB-dependent receptor [Chitinophagaceae bacterium]